MNYTMAVYEIRFGNHVYVGKSTQVEHRKKNHTYELSKGKHHNQHMQRVYNDCGKSSMQFIILKTFTDVDEMDEFEIQKIREVREDKFLISLNYTDGGNGGRGYKHSDERKEKIRQAKLGKSLSKEHRIAIGKGNLGKHNIKHSQETKNKIADTLRNKIRGNPEAIEKFREMGRLSHIKR